MNSSRFILISIILAITKIDIIESVGWSEVPFIRAGIYKYDKLGNVQIINSISDKGTVFPSATTVTYNTAISNSSSITQFSVSLCSFII